MANHWGNYDTKSIVGYNTLIEYHKSGKTHYQGASLIGTRVLTLLTRDPVCKGCGHTILFFAVQRNKIDGGDSYHINGWTIKGKGNIVLMTRDHIIPKSLGGSNDVSNSQVMCTKCNSNKASMSDEEFMKCYYKIIKNEKSLINIEGMLLEMENQETYEKALKSAEKLMRTAQYSLDRIRNFVLTEKGDNKHELD